MSVIADTRTLAPVAITDTWSRRTLVKNLLLKIDIELMKPNLYLLIRFASLNNPTFFIHPCLVILGRVLDNRTMEE